MCIVYQFCIHVAGVTYSFILVRDHISDCHCYNTYSPYYACVDQCILLSSFITIPLTGACSLHLCVDVMIATTLSQHPSTNIDCAIPIRDSSSSHRLHHSSISRLYVITPNISVLHLLCITPHCYGPPMHHTNHSIMYFPLLII